MKREKLERTPIPIRYYTAREKIGLIKYRDVASELIYQAID